MGVSIAKKDRKVIFFITGEIDHHAAAPLMRRLENGIDDAMPRDCVLDLGGVTFMDSSGIAVILRTYRLMNALEGRLWIENVPAQPMRVLEASGIERLIGITACT